MKKEVNSALVLDSERRGSVRQCKFKCIEKTAFLAQKELIPFFLTCARSNRRHGDRAVGFTFVRESSETDRRGQ